nr:conjugative transfer relaxase/helicase TraI domain-containing protein [Pantoea ananatis]
MDADKGVFTSRIHLLDELSLQSVAGSAVRENVVASFRAPKEPVPARFEKAMQAPMAILNASSSALRQRETAEQLVTMSRAHGRDVMVMAASAERALSLGKSALLKDSLMQRSRILGNGFSLAPQSTLVVDGAEKLSLKEMLVLTGEALEKNAQLLFLDGAGRTAATSALSVLEQSGVPRLSLSEPSPGLAARVISIADKRDRYQALATRYAELSGPEMTLSATVAGEREQQQLNGLIRSALKDAGKLGQEEVSVEARIPVFTTAKTRRLVNTYRPGQVLEDRSDKNETRHYVIDRVHEDTVTADQHLDYAWAVTGYGAQGASADFVIALEGTEGARQRMSGMRAFYISLSRAVDHVQIYTDGLSDWLNTLQNRGREPETAHDALDPQPERAQARLIWGMGKSLSKTAIGRAFLREQGLKHSPVTARIIPPTKKYPEPHIALPVFDGNGKTAGVSLYSLQAETGRIKMGEGRMLTTGDAQAAILRKSRNGETLVVTSLEQGLEAARSHPETGVVLQTGRRPPSAQMLKVAGGVPERAIRPDAALMSLVRTELQALINVLPRDGLFPDSAKSGQPAQAELQRAAEILSRERQDMAIKLPDAEGQKKAEAEIWQRWVAETLKEKIPALSGEKEPDYTRFIIRAAGELAENKETLSVAAEKMLASLTHPGLPAGIVLQDKALPDISVSPSVLKQLAAEQDSAAALARRAPVGLSDKTLSGAARELRRQDEPVLPSEGRGREREEHQHELTRNIQKER